MVCLGAVSKAPTVNAPATPARRLLHRPQPERAGARLRVFRGGAGETLGGAPHDRGAEDRGKHRQAAGLLSLRRGC
jgi:hypothetical protein